MFNFQSKWSIIGWTHERDLTFQRGSILARAAQWASHWQIGPLDTFKPSLVPLSFFFRTEKHFSFQKVENPSAPEDAPSWGIFIRLIFTSLKLMNFLLNRQSRNLGFWNAKEKKKKKRRKMWLMPDDRHVKAGQRATTRGMLPTLRVNYTLSLSVCLYAGLMMFWHWCGHAIDRRCCCCCFCRFLSGEDDDRDLLRGLLRRLIIPQHKKGNEKLTLPLDMALVHHRFIRFLFQQPHAKCPSNFFEWKHGHLCMHKTMMYANEPTLASLRKHWKRDRPIRHQRVNIATKQTQESWADNHGKRIISRVNPEEKKKQLSRSDVPKFFFFFFFFQKC